MVDPIRRCKPADDGSINVCGTDTERHRLSPELRASYLAEYERRIDAAYPVRTDGRRLLAFPRMFIVARKAA